MNLRQFLSIPEYSEILAVSGQEDLDREVTSINIVDSEDIHLWLLGNELLLTNGYVFKDNPALISQVIEKVNDAGAAGMLIKIGRYINDIPQQALDLAKRLHFPILIAKKEQEFRPLFDLFCGAGNIMGVYNEIQCSFSNLALGEVNCQQIIDLLFTYCGSAVLYYDLENQTVLTNKGYCGNIPEYESIAEKALCGELKSIVIEVGKTCFGILVVLRDSRKLDSDNRFVIALRNSVDLMRFSIRLHLSGQSSGLLNDEMILQALLFGRNELGSGELYHRLVTYGFRANVPLSVLVIRQQSKSTAEDKSNQFLKLIRGRLRETVCGIAVPLAEHFAVLLQPHCMRECADEKITAFAKNLHVFLQTQTHNNLSVGVGRCIENPAQAHLSYADALQALSLGDMLDRKDVLIYSAMGDARFLSEAANLPEAKAFIKRTLYSVMEHDANTPEKLLMPTLRAIVACGFNMRKAADELYIHYNTLQYRYEKICALLGMDLSEFKNRVRVYNALLLAQILYNIGEKMEKE